jgi:hypothetical protein
MLKRVVVSFAAVTDRWNDKELLAAVKAAILHITVPVKPLNVALLVDLGRPCTARLHPGIGPGRVPRRVSLSLGGSQFRLSLPLTFIADATLDRSRDTIAACLTTTVKQQQFTEADLVRGNKTQFKLTEEMAEFVHQSASQAVNYKLCELAAHFHELRAELLNKQKRIAEQLQQHGLSTLTPDAEDYRLAQARIDEIANFLASIENARKQAAPQVICPNCRVCQPQDEFETSELTGKRVCPSCGYEGTFNQAAWDALFNFAKPQNRKWSTEAQKLVEAAPKPTKKLTEYIEDLAHRSRDLRDGARDRMDGSRFQGRVEACDEILRMLRALDL